ncbi:MAG: glycosyltransferase, partial [bacterium]
MKKALILSYYFPPIGMGGTQRIAGFVKHLPEFCWQPTVVTVKSIAYYAYDNDLLKEIGNAKIERTGSLDPLRLAAKFQRAPATATAPISTSVSKNLLLKVLNLFLVPDNKIPWYPFAYLRAKSLLRRTKFDAIISTGPPHSTHLIAKRLSRKFRIPWIADFRDTWANGDFQAKSTPLHSYLDAYLQKKVLRTASHITAVSEGLAQTLRASVQRAKDDFTVITNGYEEADFRLYKKPKDKCFDVVHVGAIGNFARPELAIRTFRLFVEDALLSPQGAKLHFVGADISGELDQMVADAEMQEYIITTGYVPHHEAVKYLHKADVLLYLVSGDPNAGFIPGKTFEYMAARKPVLAISDEIEGLQLLRKTGLVYRVASNDLPGAVNALKAAFIAHKKHEQLEPTDFDIQQFTRRNLMRKL